MKRIAGKSRCHRRRPTLHFPMSFRILIVAAIVAVGGSPVAGQRYRLGDIPDESKRDPLPLSGTAGVGEEPDQPLFDEVAEEFYGKAVAALKAGKVRVAESYFDRVLILKPDHGQAREGIRLIMKMRERDTGRRKRGSKAAPNVDPKEQLTRSLLKELNAAYAARDWSRADRLAGQVLAIDPGNHPALEKRRAIKRVLFSESVLAGKAAEKAGDTAAAIAAYRKALAHRNDDGIVSAIARLERNLRIENKKAAGKIYLSALKASQRGDAKKALNLCRRVLDLDPDNIPATRMLERLLADALR